MKQLKPLWFVIITLTIINILTEIFLAYEFRNMFASYNFIISFVLLTCVLIATTFSYLDSIKPENRDTKATTSNIVQMVIFVIITIFYMIRNYYDYYALKNQKYLLL